MLDGTKTCALISGLGIDFETHMTCSFVFLASARCIQEWQQLLAEEAEGRQGNAGLNGGGLLKQLRARSRHVHS